MLAQYGFIDNFNPVMQPVFLKQVKVADSDPLKAAKMEFLGENFKEYGVLIKVEFDNLYTQQSLSVLRVIFFDEVENIDKLMSYKESYAET